MMSHWIGIAIIVVPVLLIAALILKRPVFWFLTVLIAVGIGYLHYTGADVELGNAVLVEVDKVYPLGDGVPRPGEVGEPQPSNAPAPGGY